MFDNICKISVRSLSNRAVFGTKLIVKNGFSELKTFLYYPGLFSQTRPQPAPLKIMSRGSVVFVRIDSIRFLAGCRKRRLYQVQFCFFFVKFSFGGSCVYLW